MLLSPDGRPFAKLGSRSKQLTGMVFGRLTVIGPVRRDRDARLVYLCQCSCGTYKDVTGSQFTSGGTRSCGCLQRESVIKRNLSHGWAKTRTYEIWSGVIRRCKAKSGRLFNYYGARGITICDRWLRFENFLEDMGEAPDDLTLERVDNEKGYYPENCCWATRTQQANNRRNNHKVFYEGEQLTIAEFVRRTGLNYSTTQSRLLKGWSVEEVLKQCG